MDNYYFNDAHHAMLWATEVLRKKRFPRISGFYRKIEREEPLTEEESKWLGEYGQLPTEWDDRQSLAIQVYKLLDHLTDDQWQLLRLRYWGDYYDENNLRRMEAMQEKLRMQNKRLKLNYRYSYRQVGTALGIDHKTARKRLDIALRDLYDELLAIGLVVPIGGLSQEQIGEVGIAK